MPQDVIRRYKEAHADDWEQFPDKVAFQMNDTHPTLLGAQRSDERRPSCCQCSRCCFRCLFWLPLLAAAACCCCCCCRCCCALPACSPFPPHPTPPELILTLTNSPTSCSC